MSISSEGAALSLTRPRVDFAIIGLASTMSPRLISLILAVFLALTSFGQASDKVGRKTGLPLPRFVSLKSSQVNLRAGPGQQYPVDWVFLRKAMPVEVVDEFDVWRKIRDSEGTEGWVHETFLQSRRSVMVTGGTRALKRSNREDSETVAMAEPGVIGRLAECREAWCRVEIAGTRGWLKRSDFWGVYPEETVK